MLYNLISVMSSSSLVESERDSQEKHLYQSVFQMQSLFSVLNTMGVHVQQTRPLAAAWGHL